MFLRRLKTFLHFKHLCPSSGNVMRSHRQIVFRNNRPIATALQPLKKQRDGYYNKVAITGTYDKVRPVSVGIDVVAGMIMAQYGPKTKNIRILDAGCGTGGPAKGLLKYGFQHLTLMDSSVGMLHVAQEKLKQEIKQGLIENVVEAKLPCIPYTDGSFDVALFSLVLHNLVVEPDGTHFPEIIDTLQEAHRVLRKGGMVVIVTLTPFQLQKAVWWLKLLPDVTKRYIQRYPSIEQWGTIFEKCNFRSLNKISLLGKEIQGNWYLDAAGPIKKEWRDAFAYFNMLSTDEEIELKNKMLKMKNCGILEEWMNQNDRTNELGFATVFVCTAE